MVTLNLHYTHARILRLAKLNLYHSLKLCGIYVSWTTERYTILVDIFFPISIRLMISNRTLLGKKN